MSTMWAIQQKMEDSSGDKKFVFGKHKIFPIMTTMRGNTSELTGICQLDGKLSQGGKCGDKDLIGFL